MALMRNAESAELLNGRRARLGGLVSVVLSVAGVACLIAYLAADHDTPGGAAALAAGWIAVLVVVGVCGVHLIRGRTWAQRTLMVFWLAMLAGGVLFLLARLLGETLGAQSELLPISPEGLAGILVAGGSLAVWTLVTAGRGRLRYASVAAVTIAAAVTLTIVVNMIAQRDYYRRSIESLGRYSISKRTERILGGLGEPLRLTCVYTGTKDAQKGEKYSARVWELLQDMGAKARKLGEQVDLANVTSDAQRARIDRRLGAKQRGGETAKHEEFLQAFTASAVDLSRRLNAEKSRWDKLPGKSYLSQWPIAPAVVSRNMDQLAKRLDQRRAALQGELARTGMRNYPALTDPTRLDLKDVVDTLVSYRGLLGRIGALPGEVAANRAKVLAAVDRSTGAVAAMAAAVGKESDPPPSDPAKVLGAFVKAASQASGEALKAAEALKNVAGKDNVALVINSADWLVVSEGQRFGLDKFFGQMSGGIRNLGIRVGQIAKTYTPENQAKVIATLRKTIPKYQATFADTKTRAQKAISALSEIDKPTEAICASAASGKLFAEIVTDAKRLLERADKLPELKADTLTEDLREDNIVIAEAGGKTEVIGFEEVWPLRQRPMFGAAASSGAQARTFNGDSVIASRILSMTQESFATVLVAYVRPPAPTPQMRMFGQVAPDPRSLFTEIRKRLEAANFKVRDWEITQPYSEQGAAEATSEAAETTARPRILLVLPPLGTVPMSGRQIDNLRSEIDSGTPAVFVMIPRAGGWGLPPDLKLTEYLRGNWGIDVMNQYVIVPAVPDETDPSQLRLQDQLLQWLPLSNFSDHPIGKSLQAQRLLWQALGTCPLQETAIVPEGVGIEPLLTIGHEQRGIFATARIRELAQEFYAGQAGVIRPDFSAEPQSDLRPPLDLAVAASRVEDKAAGRKPSRVVVLTVGISLMDAYLERRVEARSDRGTISLTDRPTMNADLVVNSAYWLIGLEDRIAAGPAQVKPVNIQAYSRTLLLVVFAIGLPLVVLVAGGCVMLVRSR
ncbi:MAG: hypothetical protein QF577_01940 [Phycisphaerae bacterium]|nr:hypothetical protein [Phycisphaerae bacterium]MDP7636288.1 hypothetical protein [Phycisphaerae bacterium]